MKVWIVAKARAKGAVWVHGLTEENQHVRLLRADGSPPFPATKFDTGQVWDLTFLPAPRRISPHMEDVVVTRGKQLDPEPDLRALLLSRVTPWRGSPDTLFGGYLRRVMNVDNVFLSERSTFLPISMGYWLPDASLMKWSSDEFQRPRYRYWTQERELVTIYTGFLEPISHLPAQTLVHVALQRWWTPSHAFAVEKSSRVERRCYLSIAAWYL